MALQKQVSVLICHTQDISEFSRVEEARRVNAELAMLTPGTTYWKEANCLPKITVTVRKMEEKLKWGKSAKLVVLQRTESVW